MVEDINMHPVIRALGKVLRLVGISSPEDAAAKKASVPSWRKAAGGPGAVSEANKKDSEK